MPQENDDDHGGRNSLEEGQSQEERSGLVMRRDAYHCGAGSEGDASDKCACRGPVLEPRVVVPRELSICLALRLLQKSVNLTTNHSDCAICIS